MKRKLLILFAALLVLPAPLVYASQCVTCHTSSKMLKEIAKTIPKPVSSAETAGKG